MDGSTEKHTTTPRFDDGQVVKTSSVFIPESDEPAKEGDTLETRNSFYLLGKAGKRDDRNR